MMANVLANSVELALGRGPSLEQVMQTRDSWRDGRMETSPSGSWMVIFPQFVNTSPTVVGELPFRRSLLHSIDRRQLVDAFMAGLVPVAHTLVSPSQPEFADIESSIVAYDYDPRRAAQLIEGLGYVKGGDGYFRDASGQQLAVELRTTGDNDIHRKLILPVADAWQRVGVATEPVVVPVQRQREAEYMVSFPGFLMLLQGNYLLNLPNLQSSRASLPENNYVPIGNYSRYMNPEFDALIDQYSSRFHGRSACRCWAAWWDTSAIG